MFILQKEEANTLVLAIATKSQTFFSVNTCFRPVLFLCALPSEHKNISFVFVVPTGRPALRHCAVIAR